jgi:isopenicillin N synthase-like dioxygenase
MDQSLLASSPVSTSKIPVLDIGDYLADAPGSLEAAASQLRFALENIGFFYLIGHGVAARQTG